MLDFLTTPFLFLGAAAAAIPIVLHLILRNRPETVYFAAMRFLVTTPKNLLRRQKLKQILLLLLRLLAVLLLGLAFARPLWTGKHVPVVLGQEPRALVLIVDVSASMAAAQHLPEAVARATAVLQGASDNDRIFVLAAALRLELLAENVKPAQALAALSHLQQRQSCGNLREALQFADNLLLQSPLRRREIYLISDFQVSNFSVGRLKLNSNAECRPVALAGDWQNLAISNGERVTHAGQTNYLCQVRNFTASAQDVTVSLHFSGSATAQQRVHVPAREERTVRFAISTSPARRNAEARGAYFEILEADALAADNRRYLAPEIDSSAHVLMVGGDPEAEFFLQNALASPALAYRLHAISANALEHTILDNYAAVILAGVPGLNSAAAERLLAYVRAGGGLIIFLRENLALEPFNHFMSALLPGRIVAVAGDGHAGGESVALTQIDFAHPIFKIFRDPGHGDPSMVQARQYYRIEPRPEAVRLAGFEEGSAALLELGVGKGKTLTWSSALNARSGNLPVRGIFVPMLLQWLDYVRRPETAVAAQTYAGEPIFLSEAFARDKPLTLIRPDGVARNLPPLNTAAFNETDEIGWYRFEQDRTAWLQAVNIDARESDPALLAADDLLANLSRDRDQAEISSFFGNAAAPLQERERQQKLWKYALWTLLVLLLAESWLANRTPR